MEISKIKIPGVQNPIDIKDTVVRQNLESQDEAVSVALHELKSESAGISDVANQAYAIAGEAPDSLAVSAALNDLESAFGALNIKMQSHQNEDMLAISAALNVLNNKIILLQNAIDQLNSQLNN